MATRQLSAARYTPPVATGIRQPGLRPRICNDHNLHVVHVAPRLVSSNGTGAFTGSCWSRSRANQPPLAQLGDNHNTSGLTKHFNIMLSDSTPDPTGQQSHRSEDQDSSQHLMLHEGDHICAECMCQMHVPHQP